MQDTTIQQDAVQLVIQPTPRSLACAIGFLVGFGGVALAYAVGVCSLLRSVPNDLSWWESALIVGMPISFALALTWWIWDSRRAFCLDRDRGMLFDGERPVLSLASVEAVAVRTDPGETQDFFAIDLVLDTGKTFSLRRDWWPLDGDAAIARGRARQIADFLGVELRDESLTAT